MENTTTKINKAIKAKEQRCFVFVPNHVFYENVGINRKRWAQIRRGEADPTITELNSIADYFEINIQELI